MMDYLLGDLRQVPMRSLGSLFFELSKASLALYETYIPRCVTERAQDLVNLLIRLTGWLTIYVSVVSLHQLGSAAVLHLLLVRVR